MAVKPSSQHNAGWQGKMKTISQAKLLLLLATQLFAVSARPLGAFGKSGDEPDPKDATMWVYLTIAMALVLLGGAFAGLTIALMGQDEVYLQVIATSGEPSEQKHAGKVLRLIQRGKHWVLVTLLVGNVITNETLPLVIDRSLGGGYTAAISSTVLVIIFGEIIPQSLCVRFGLPIGAMCAPFVLVLMYIFAPITWPIAKLLDYLLGEEHGTMYKKSGLKTLVTLHGSMGPAPSERLNKDEVEIISSVLDLKDKSVGSIMTPMSDVFTLSADAVLDEELMETIMREGYSRIPIYDSNDKNDFVGMLLVKLLITYDPEDCYKVTDFALATLPETAPDTSCLDIINFFQEGKSHMVLVSDAPGSNHGALGVVTLEDVIEELIGEEIIDESDVYVDVHKAIKRTHTPMYSTNYTRATKKIANADGQKTEDGDTLIQFDEPEEQEIKEDKEAKDKGDDDRRVGRPTRQGQVFDVPDSRSPRRFTFNVPPRKTSAGYARQFAPELREQLRKLAPSNSANQPKPTKFGAVHIKPGPNAANSNRNRVRSSSVTTPRATAAQGGIGKGLVTPGASAKDGVQAVQIGYGSFDKRSDSRAEKEEGSMVRRMSPEQRREMRKRLPRSLSAYEAYVAKKSQSPLRQNEATSPDRVAVEDDDDSQAAITSSASSDTLSSDGGLTPKDKRSSNKHRPGAKSNDQSANKRQRVSARSGSITENMIEGPGGTKKLVLELTSSNESVEEGSSKDVSRTTSSTSAGNKRKGGQDRTINVEIEQFEDGKLHVTSTKNKKKRRKRGSKSKDEHAQEGKGDDNNEDEGANGKDKGDENTPLLHRSNS